MTPDDLLKQTNLVCLSAHLKEGVSGHFYQYHKSLYLFLKRYFNVNYLGSAENNQSASQAWFLPILPKSLGKPRPRISESQMKDIVTGAATNSANASLYYTYEGSLFWLILALKIVEKNDSAIFLINLFNSRKTVSRLSGRNQLIWRKVYNRILKEAKGRVLLAADNLKFFHKLTRIFPEDSVRYVPLIPSLPLDETIKRIATETLIVIRGEYGEGILKSIAPYITETNQLSVHGLDKMHLIEIGLPKASVSTGNLTHRQYIDKHSQYAKCVFLYDPSDFGYQSSGRFVDAHFAGVPILIPETTAMAEEFPDCPLIKIFSEDNLASIIDFVREPYLLEKHSCEVYPVQVKSQIEEMLTSTQSILIERLELSLFAKLSISPLLILMNLQSFLTAGGTINKLSILEKLRRTTSVFRCNIK